MLPPVLPPDLARADNTAPGRAREQLRPHELVQARTADVPGDDRAQRRRRRDHEVERRVLELKRRRQHHGGGGRPVQRYPAWSPCSGGATPALNDDDTAIVADEVETWPRLGKVTVMCGTSLTTARMPSAADDDTRPRRTRWLPRRRSDGRGTCTGPWQAVTRARWTRQHRTSATQVRGRSRRRCTSSQPGRRAKKTNSRPGLSGGTA